MFRVSQFMHTIADPTSAAPMRKPKAPVVIWNLIRRCNLCCKHCYSIRIKNIRTVCSCNYYYTAVLFKSIHFNK